MHSRDEFLQLMAMAFRRYPRLLAGWLLLVVMAFVPRLAAQSVLCVESEGKAYVVRKVHSGRPYVEKDGKLVSVTSSRCGLKPVPEFFPAFVSVRNVKVTTSHVELIDSASEINHTFNFEAEFKSPYALENVFLALELDLDRVGKAVFYYEVGSLGPDQSRSLDLHIPLTSNLGAGQYKLHVFTEGGEVFNSEHPMPYRESMLDRMIAKRVEGVQDAPPQPFYGPTPEYPKALRKAGTKGSVLLSIRITRTGAVLDPVVKEATDPAFGEAALAAVRLWRFLPKMEKGRAQDVTVNMPFMFSPPEEKQKS